MQSVFEATEWPLLISTNNEHYASEFACLDHLGKSGGVDALMVVGGADTSVHVATRHDVATLRCVDMNAAQVHLLHFKLACVAGRVTNAEAGRYFRHTPAADAEERVAFYESRVRPWLAQEERDYWDGRRALELALGLLDCGQAEVHLTRHIQSVLGQDMCQRLVSDRDLSQASSNVVLRAKMDGATFMDKMGILKKLKPEQVAHLTSLADRFVDLNMQGINRLLATQAPRTKWALTSQLLSSFADDSDIWWCSQQPIRAALSFAVGDVLGDLQKSSQQYDFMSLSNIFDWIPDAALPGAIAPFVAHLKPNGILLLRRAIGGLEGPMSQHLHVPAELTAQLEGVDEAPFFFRAPGTVVAGVKKA